MEHKYGQKRPNEFWREKNCGTREGHQFFFQKISRSQNGQKWPNLQKNYFKIQKTKGKRPKMAKMATSIFYWRISSKNGQKMAKFLKKGQQNFFWQIAFKIGQIC